MRIHRILANNPGPFTGPGTNTWLVDDGGGCVVIDPGPVDDIHRDRIVEQTAQLTPLGVLVTTLIPTMPRWPTPWPSSWVFPPTGMRQAPPSTPTSASAKAL